MLHADFEWRVVISTPIHWFHPKLHMHAALLKDAQLFLLLCTNFEPFAVISSGCLHLQLPMPPSPADINNNNCYFYSYGSRVNTSYGWATTTTCINTNVKWTTAATTTTSIQYLKNSDMLWIICNVLSNFYFFFFSLVCCAGVWWAKNTCWKRPMKKTKIKG